MTAGSDKPAIIFDFDGTLADSLYATLQVLFELIHRQALPAEDISRLRGMTMRQVLRELNIPAWRALFLKQTVYKAMRDRMDNIALIPGMDEAIKRLATGHQLYVLSSNDAVNVRIFLGRFRLGDYFNGVYGDANPFGKARQLKRLVREHALDASQAWYVGDQTWDVTAAHRAGMKAAAVAWGFSNLHVLKAKRPEAMVFSPDELAKAIAG